MSEHRLLTRRGLAVLGAAALCYLGANIVSAPQLAVISVFLVALPVIGIFVVYLPGARGEVTRLVSTDFLTVGEHSTVTVRLRLRGRLIRRARWRDTLPEALRGTAEGFVAAAGQNADSREPTVLRYGVVGVRRGIWPLGPLHVRTSDPFGLVNRRQQIGTARMITIAPQLVAVPALGALRGAAGGSTQTASQRIGPGADNLAPRRYFPGDTTRRIHWRATAHRGELMVRQEDEETSPDAVVLLDLRPARWAPRSEAEDAHFERAVSAVASAALSLEDAGYLVDVVASDGRLLGTLRGNETGRTALLMALTEVQPRGEEKLPTLPAGLTGPFVMITGRVTAGDVPRHPESTALVLAAEPASGALAALRAQGWRALLLEEAVSDA